MWGGGPCDSRRESFTARLTRACLRAGGFFYGETTPGRSTSGEPPDAGRAVEGDEDRPRGDHQGLPAGRCPDLSGQDRQDAVPGAARGDGRRLAAALPLRARPAGAPQPTPRTQSYPGKCDERHTDRADFVPTYFFGAAARERVEPDRLFDAAAFGFAAAAAGLRFFASATLRFRASSRSTTGASGCGSATRIFSPFSFASSIARRSRRYWLVRTPGSNSSARLAITCRARSSSV